MITTKELLLKTMFACMSCDGDIAPEEVGLVKQMVKESDLFDGMDVEAILNQYVSQVNKNGRQFFNQYLSEVAESELTPKEQLTLIALAFKTIEADNVIEYSEVKFFKKIRSRLPISDSDILERFPDKEDFLLPDINVAEELEWTDVNFDNIQLVDAAVPTDGDAPAS